MAEWSKAAVLKTVVGATPPGVRIPLSPQSRLSNRELFLFKNKIVFLSKKRRDAGVVERGGLENRCASIEAPGVRIPLSPQTNAKPAVYREYRRKE